jgi:hypothetical protein
MTEKIERELPSEIIKAIDDGNLCRASDMDRAVEELQEGVRGIRDPPRTPTTARRLRELSRRLRIRV